MSEENEKTYIEYPLNYEEIVSKKLAIIEKDYENTIKSNFNDKLDESDEESEICEDNNHYNYQRLDEVEDEFIQVEENQIIDIEEDITKEIEFINDNKNNESIKISYSNPIKDPEKIREAMRKIKLTPPKWAQKYINLIIV